MDLPVLNETKSPASGSNQPSRASSVEGSLTPQQHNVNGGESTLSTTDPNKKPELTDGLEQAIAEDPYDADAWLTLLNEAEREGEVKR
ncbi:hypothetical protein BX616_006966, partial [Lobosporangium transversale]